MTVGIQAIFVLTTEDISGMRSADRGMVCMIEHWVLCIYLAYGIHWKSLIENNKYIYTGLFKEEDRKFQKRGAAEDEGKYR